MTCRARSLLSNFVALSTAHGDTLITTSFGCMRVRSRRVIASVVHGFEAEKPPLKPGPQSHDRDTIVGRTLVIIVESPT